jgi:RNA polymerase sigma-70 factor (ECF subfamily)
MWRQPVEQRLLARVARGDQRAFAALYDRVAPAVFRVAFFHSGGEPAAVSAAESVLCQLWRDAPTLSARAEPVLPYLREQVRILAQSAG